jgi:hypothetical protein
MIRNLVKYRKSILKIYTDAYEWKLEKELYLYDFLKQSPLPVAKVLHSDLTKAIFPNNYLIMSLLPGATLKSICLP